MTWNSLWKPGTVLFIAVAFASTSFDAAMAGTVTATVESTGTDALPWDFAGGAPDLAICVITPANTQCDRERYGKCQDKFECTWDKVVFPKEAFTLWIFDADVTDYGAVGAVTCSEKLDCSPDPAGRVKTVAVADVGLSVPLTRPWSGMNLPVGSGNVLYNDEKILTITYTGQTPQALFDSWQRAILADNWAESGRTDVGGNISVNYYIEMDVPTSAAYPHGLAVQSLNLSIAPGSDVLVVSLTYVAP